MAPSLAPLPAGFQDAVAALHRIAREIVDAAGDVALGATPGGFGTEVYARDGVTRQARVEGASLVEREGDAERRTPLDVDADAARALGDFYALGAAALAQLAAGAGPDDAPTPQRLWPGHFDLALELGAVRANYGVSPGDAEHPEPYAYVGPWEPVAGPLWQADGFPGAELSHAELRAAPDPLAALLAFFTTRKAALDATPGTP